jgi:hypothetical protein
LLVLSVWKKHEGSKTITWYLEDTKQVGGFNPVVLGNPVGNVEGKESSVYFDGIKDGLVIPVIPYVKNLQFQNVKINGQQVNVENLALKQ